MEKDIINWYSMSDPAILKSIGNFVRQIRLQQNLTQQDVANSAGVNRSTIVLFEKGAGGTLLSFIQILRALGQLEWFKNFEVKQQISPLLLAEMEMKKRKRARNKKTENGINKKSEW